MAKYSHDHIMPFKDSGEDKKHQIARMFDKIAFRYDLLNRLLSGGNDARWRKKAIAELVAEKPQIILDVATGTAEVAIQLDKYLHPRQIVGIDISETMLELGRQKIAGYRSGGTIELLLGDSEAINFPDSTFDAVTVAFGVRNFGNLEKGLKEMLRVIKPGGKLVVLEFSKPKHVFLNKIYSLYMQIAAAGAGRLVARSREAYEYLHKSVDAFPEGKDFLDILQNAGYTGIYLKTLTLGICTIYCGKKKEC